jgi:hypothetical protein
MPSNWIRFTSGSARTSHGGFDTIGLARKEADQEVKRRVNGGESWKIVSKGKWERADGATIEAVQK